MTYWSTQSFRTLTHWQSGRGGRLWPTLTTQPVFSGEYDSPLYFADVSVTDGTVTLPGDTGYVTLEDTVTDDITMVYQVSVKVVFTFSSKSFMQMCLTSDSPQNFQLSSPSTKYTGPGFDGYVLYLGKTGWAYPIQRSGKRWTQTEVFRPTQGAPYGWSLYSNEDICNAFCYITQGRKTYVTASALIKAELGSLSILEAPDYITKGGSFSKDLSWTLIQEGHFKAPYGGSVDPAIGGTVKALCIPLTYTIYKAA